MNLAECTPEECPDGSLALIVIYGSLFTNPEPDEVLVVDAATGASIGRPLPPVNGPLMFRSDGRVAISADDGEGGLVLCDPRTGQVQSLLGAGADSAGEVVAQSKNGSRRIELHPHGLVLRDAHKGGIIDRRPPPPFFPHATDSPSLQPATPAFSPDGRLAFLCARAESSQLRETHSVFATHVRSFGLFDTLRGRRVGALAEEFGRAGVAGSGWGPLSGMASRPRRAIADGGHGVVAVEGDVIAVLDRGVVHLRRWPSPVAGSAARIACWVEVITGKELDPAGEIHELSSTAWVERRRRLDDLGGPPQTFDAK